ncbi:unnamed protein product [Dovyalis caffra]|uniref:Uncharacterized protein n=1 Tax=Dovyalis caffra TaxID=77055 RepID=A0AAV1RHV4_9ROSI|nr:unnamed protein product [Dovyalis caffra]
MLAIGMGGEETQRRSCKPATLREKLKSIKTMIKEKLFLYFGYKSFNILKHEKFSNYFLFHPLKIAHRYTLSLPINIFDATIHSHKMITPYSPL